jgi:hypothetical protein
VRAHTQKNTKPQDSPLNLKFIVPEEKKTKINNKDIKKIIAYSAIKIKANPTAPYSTLNPDTNSDSPSAKSNGVRLVSAKQEINHTPIKGKKIKDFPQKRFSSLIILRFINFTK